MKVEIKKEEIRPMLRLYKKLITNTFSERRVFSKAKSENLIIKLNTVISNPVANTFQSRSMKFIVSTLLIRCL